MLSMICSYCDTLFAVMFPPLTVFAVMVDMTMLAVTGLLKMFAVMVVLTVLAVTVVLTMFAVMVGLTLLAMTVVLTMFAVMVVLTVFVVMFVLTVHACCDVCAENIRYGDCLDNVFCYCCANRFLL